MTFVNRAWRVALGFGLLLVAVLAAPALAKGVGVSIEDKSYNPAKIEVEVGDTVTWTVTKSIGEPHSVTAGKPGDTNPAFDSGIDGLKDDGSRYERTFDAPGTFDYYCTVHPDVMKGVVEVIEGGEGPIPPEKKLIAGGILVGTLVVLFVANWFWRRMNPA